MCVLFSFLLTILVFTRTKHTTTNTYVLCHTAQRPRRRICCGARRTRAAPLAMLPREARRAACHGRQGRSTPRACRRHRHDSRGRALRPGALRHASRDGFRVNVLAASPPHCYRIHLHHFSSLPLCRVLCQAAPSSRAHRRRKGTHRTALPDSFATPDLFDVLSAAPLSCTTRRDGCNTTVQRWYTPQGSMYANENSRHKRPLRRLSKIISHAVPLAGYVAHDVQRHADMPGEGSPHTAPRSTVGKGTHTPHSCCALLEEPLVHTEKRRARSADHGQEHTAHTKAGASHGTWGTVYPR